MAQLPESLAPLRHANFRWYWIALTVNAAGSTMSAVALAFAVLAISDSPSALGVVLAAGTVPTVVFLLFGGVIAGRFPVTAVLRVGMAVVAASQAVVAVLVITDAGRIWMLAALSAVNGTALAAVFPAMQSMTPRLVSRELLQRAIGLQSFSRAALRVIGPTISALLVVGVGPGWALAFDAGTWGAAAVILARVHLPPQEPREAAASTASELRAGWDYVRRTTWLWVVVLAFSLLNVIYAGAWLTLGPARANETFGPQGWGLVLSAESVGLIVANVFLLHRPLQRPLFTGMVWTAVLALPLFVLGVYPHVWLMLLCAFLAGIGFDVFGMGWNLAMQENVPEDMLSRAYSYDALGSFVAIPLGQVAFGPLGAAFGFRDVLVVSAVVYAVICLVTLGSRSVRELPRARVEPGAA